MISFVLIFISICASSVLVESKTKLGDVVPECSLNDVDCLKTSSQNILPKLATGVKGWHVVGLDPILVPSIIVGQNTGPISMRWEHINATITGFSHLAIKSAKVTKKGDLYDFSFDAKLDKFSIANAYKAKGKMLFFPLNNQGHQEIRSGPSIFKINFEAKPEKRNNEEYLKIQKFVVKIEFSNDIKVFLKSSHKKPTPIDNILSKFITDNAPEIVQEMASTFETTFGEIMKSYIQSVFENIPLKDLFKN